MDSAGMPLFMSVPTSVPKAAPKAEVIWDPEECSRHGFAVDAFYEECCGQFLDRWETIGKNRNEFLQLLLESLMASKFDKQAAQLWLEKKVLQMENRIWTDKEKMVFRDYLQSERFFEAQKSSTVVPVQLERCSREFLPQRNPRECWQHFFDENYHEKIRSPTFPDKPGSGQIGRRTRRRQTGWACANCTFLNSKTAKTCQMCNLAPATSLQNAKPASPFDPLALQRQIDAEREKKRKRPSCVHIKAASRSRGEPVQDDASHKVGTTASKSVEYSEAETHETLPPIVHFVEQLQRRGEPSHLANVLEALIKYDARSLTSAEAMKRIRQVARETGLSAEFLQLTV